jgi:hypothetical protein
MKNNSQHQVHHEDTKSLRKTNQKSILVSALNPFIFLLLPFFVPSRLRGEKVLSEDTKSRKKTNPTDFWFWPLTQEFFCCSWRLRVLAVKGVSLGVLR